MEGKLALAGSLRVDPDPRSRDALATARDVLAAIGYLAARDDVAALDSAVPTAIGALRALMVTARIDSPRHREMAEIALDGLHAIAAPHAPPVDDTPSWQVGRICEDMLRVGASAMALVTALRREREFHGRLVRLMDRTRDVDLAGAGRIVGAFLASGPDFEAACERT